MRVLLLGEDGLVRTDKTERTILFLFKTEANVHTSCTLHTSGGHYPPRVQCA